MKKYIAILALAILGLALGIRAQESAPDDNNQAPPADTAPAPPAPEEAPAPEAPPPPPSTAPEANAQVPADGQAQSVDASPGVARVSLIQGNLSTQHGENSAWEAATLNTPVLPGDRISTGDNSRAEVQLDYANVVRLDQNSTVKVADVTRSRVLLQVSQGLVNFGVLRGDAPSAEIDTPNVAMKPSQQGSYRIEVDSDSETKVTVRSGSADVSTPQGSVHVNNGQMIEVQGTDNPQYQVVDAPAKDAWDDFNNERDHKFISAQSWSHTDPYYTGTQDMDGYGEWSEIPDYGSVWTPTVAPGWAPYRDGRWVYEPYWGWTWVSYEPWGWAPYHYGRWFMNGANWAWWPGPVAAYPDYDPMWAPAYVSFFGFGRGWGAGFGFGFGGGWGTIGWLPCGPGDYFRPWYGGWGERGGFVGMGGLRGFHDGFAPLYRGQHGFSNFNSVMTNERVRGGLTAMRGDQFGRAAVAGHMERVDAATFRQGSMLGGRMAITPTRASYQSVDRGADRGTIRGYTPNHFFSARQAPNRTLTARAGMMAQGTPGDSRSGGNQSFGNRGSNNRLVGNGATNGGRSFGQSGGQFAQNGAGNRAGWHNFGQANNSGRGGFGNSGRQGTLNSNPGYGRSGGSVGNESRSYDSRGYQSRPLNSGTEGNRGGNWRGFSGSSSPRTSPSPSPSNGRSYQGYGGGGRSYSGGGSYRPPLNMRQPIVSPRSYGSYGNQARSYGGGAYTRGGGYSAPSNRGGGYSAPSYRGGGSYGGGGYRGGNGGGGGYRGGGGGYRGGGGSHGGGGSRGGGGRSGGGGRR